MRRILAALGLVVTAAAVLAAHGGAAGAAHDAAAAPRPSVVVIMVDDLAPIDGRLYAAWPNIRSLFVDHGVDFSDFHGESPLCCPGRAGYLTGLHTRNHGVTINDARLLDPRMTLATQLHAIGYHTLLVGKYLNAYGLLAPAVPPGWDRFEAFGDPTYYDYTWWNDGRSIPEVHGTAAADYSTDVVADKAVAALRAAPANRPLFAWIAPFATHANDPYGTPPLPAPRYLHDPRCARMPGWAPPNYNEADVSDKPLYVRQTPLLQSPAYDLVPTCDTMLAVDDLVGRVRDELSREGRLDDTILVFAGDNGMLYGAHRLLDKRAPYATDVPFMVHWPARLGDAPRTVADRVENIDFAPTICELAGCRLGPYPDGQAHPDGTSFAALLLGTASSLGRDAVLEDMPSGESPSWDAIATTASSPLARQGCASAARGGCRWHYVEYGDGERELYDVSNGPCWAWQRGSAGDPCELQNRAGDPAYAAVQAALARRLVQLDASNGHGDRTPPSAPRGLTAQLVDPAHVLLRWQPARDDRGVAQYAITRGGVLPLATVGGGTTTYTARVQPLSSYTYSVVAVDAAGNRSDASGTATVTTPADAAGSLFSDGFENGRLTWSPETGLTVQTALRHSGTFAARRDSSPGGPAYGAHKLSLPQPEVYFRASIDVVSQGATPMTLIAARDPAGAPVASLEREADGTLGLRTGPGALLRSPAAVTPGRWHTLTLHVTLRSGADAVEVRLDGTRVAELSQTVDLGPGPVGQLLFGDAASGRRWDAAFDDLAAAIRPLPD